MAAPKGAQNSGANGDRLNSGPHELTNDITRNSHALISVTLKCEYSEMVDSHKTMTLYILLLAREKVCKGKRGTTNEGIFLSSAHKHQLLCPLIAKLIEQIQL